MTFAAEPFRARALSRVASALASAVVFLLAGGAEARAQLDRRKIEVGAQFSFLRDSSPKSRYRTLYPSLFKASSPNNPGFGGRVGYNFSSHFSAEAEINFFPRENVREIGLILGIGQPSTPTLADSSVPTNAGRKVEAVLGLKAGSRVGKMGLFAKARPGLMHFSEVWSGGADTNFAMDLGGVIEYYPSRRTLIRVDLSDVVIHFDERPYRSGIYTFDLLKSFLLGTVPSALPPVGRPVQTTHNFRLGVGFGFRF